MVIMRSQIDFRINVIFNVFYSQGCQVSKYFFEFWFGAIIIGNFKFKNFLLSLPLRVKLN